MFIRKLTITGFKSFANETTFEFDPGVTAIVGPNGSGKSNVADSVRWVLGEQNSRLIRAKKQDDVIHSAGSAKSRFGMAEVVIAIDNSDGAFPLDFKEVEISRRAYRDGSSEYLLNGTRILHRELLELLQKVNLGQNSYSFLNQGAVDHFLTMTAQERRSLVDDVAGVKQYRSRISDANKRLSDTAENLSRLQLIADELKPNLTRLRRQADRSTKYKDLTERLNSLLSDYHGVRWDEAHNSIVSANAALDQCLAEEDSAEKLVREFADALTTIGDQIKGHRESFTDREQERTNAQVNLAKFENDLSYARERKVTVTDRIKEVESELTVFKADYAALSMQDVPKELEGSDAQLGPLERDLEQAKSKFEEIDVTVNSLRRRENELKAELTWLNEKHEEFSSEIAPGEKGQATEHRAEIATRLSEAEKLVKDRWQKEEASTENINVREQEVTNAQVAVNEARSRFIRVQEELRKYETERNVILRELDALEGRFATLNHIHTEHTDLAAGPEAVLQFSEEGRDLSGVLGILVHHLRVPFALETAISAVLERRFHSVLIENRDEAIRAIELLQKNTLGRVHFLPVDTFKKTIPLNLAKERGVLGVASRLIDFDDEVRPFVETILGRVIVVSDIETAFKMAKRAFGGLIVTTDGVIVEPNGTLIGGSSSKDTPAAGAIARERDRHELVDLIKELQIRDQGSNSQVESAQLALERVNIQVDETTSQLDSAHSRLDDIRRDRGVTQEAHYRSVQERDAILSELSAFDLEQERVTRKNTENRVAVSEIESRRSVLEAELSKLTMNLRENVSVHKNLSSKMEEVASRVADFKSEMEVQKRLSDTHVQNVDRLVVGIKDREAKIEALNSEVQQIDVLLVSKEQELVSLKNKYQELRDSLEPYEVSFKNLEDREGELRSSHQEAQAALLKTQQKRLTLDSEASRATERRVSLREEMERDGFTPLTGGGIGLLGPTEISGLKESDVSVVNEGDGGLPLSEENSGSVRGGALLDMNALEDEVHSLRAQIRRLGPVNQEASEDLLESEERYNFLVAQIDDLTETEKQLHGAIGELNEKIRSQFKDVFEKVNIAFSNNFTAFFGGGEAGLLLDNAEDATDSGIEIEVKLPGKDLRSLNLLSGGERSLTAVALLFAFLMVKPAPMCILDEADASLDEANVSRFVGELKKLSEKTQFLVVTHNRHTIEATDAIYGVSMGRDGVSKTLSMRLSANL